MHVFKSPILYAICSSALFAPILAHAHGEDGHPHPELKQSVVPPMPRAAQVSGYCCLLIDVDLRGRVENIRTTFCSEDYYQEPSEVAVSQWIYEPYSVDGGAPDVFKDHKVKAHFMLSGWFGMIIPNKNGYGKRVDGKPNTESPCSDFVV